MARRGPDDAGSLTLEARGGRRLLLTQTRLAIIDTSSAGHQPFEVPEAGVSLVFNGEIYNYESIREELLKAGVTFKTLTDTEVLARAWIHWGSDSLNRIEGMFAFAVWDSFKSELTLVRDPFGVKPLYYSHFDDGIAFASTPSALVKSGLVSKGVNIQAAFSYIAYGQYDLGNQTFYSGIERLAPGYLLQIKLDEFGLEQKLLKWWNPNLELIADTGFDQAAIEVRRLFLESVKLQMRSDVPIGFALSGGVDSSAILCAARHLYPEADLLAFSYMADDPRISEEKWARIANSKAMATIYPVRFGVDSVTREIDDMTQGQGEPVSSSRIFAQYKVFEEASLRGVKVVLEGQGADEIFAGYNGFAHLRVISLLETMQLVKLAKFVIAWRKWPGRSTTAMLGQAASYIFRANRWPVRSQFFFRRKLLAEDAQSLLVLSEAKRLGLLTKTAHLHRLDPEYKGRRVTEGLLDALSKSYIPQLVRQGDRNSMHHSVENRVPFLYRPLVEYVLRLPEHFLISPEGETKSVLKAALRGIVPDEILDRRDKVGFETPQNDLWQSKVLTDAAAEVYKPNETLAFIRSKNVSGILGVALKWRYVNLALWQSQNRFLAPNDLT
jgi:asparagine synthase (glutamine-hydrolysing)